MSRPLLLDLFCGAGGAAMGYYRAGFDVVGVDIEPMPRYPFEFHQGDALEYLEAHGREYDVIHASPVCKRYTSLAALHPEKNYPDQIAETRDLLRQTGKPYIIENVEGAPLRDFVMLCGSMFGLRVYRHRLFECHPEIVMGPASCNHYARASGNAARKGNKRRAGNLQDFDIITITGHDFWVADARIAMGIDWMIRDELSQAIPPFFTEFIGLRLLEMLP